jgi:hypothetical protein
MGKGQVRSNVMRHKGREPAIAVTAREEARERNQAAFQRMKAAINQTYAPWRFLAFVDETLVADAPTFEDLVANLAGRGLDPRNALVVQAGADYPEDTTIFVLRATDRDGP